jgi:hypothetical protein
MVIDRNRATLSQFFFLPGNNFRQLFADCAGIGSGQAQSYDAGFTVSPQSKQCGEIEILGYDYFVFLPSQF